MNQTRTIRLPIHIVKELNVYLEPQEELAHKLDHEPSVGRKLRKRWINPLMMSAKCYV